MEMIPACPLWRAGRLGRQRFSALAGQGNDSSADTRPVFAGGESVERAEAGRKLAGRQMAFAVEPAEKIRGVSFTFAGIALEAAGDDVAVRVAATPDAGNHVIQAFHGRRYAPQAIKTRAGFTGMDGLAQGLAGEEVGLLEAGGTVPREFAVVHSSGPSGANLVGKPHLGYVTLFAASNQSQNAVPDELANRLADGPFG